MDVGQKRPGHPEALWMIGGASAVGGAGLRPPPFGPPIEFGEELLFGKVLPPRHQMGFGHVHKSLVLSLRIPSRDGPVQDRLPFVHAGLVGLGDRGSTYYLLKDLQVRCNDPPEVGVHRGVVEG